MWSCSPRESALDVIAYTICAQLHPKRALKAAVSLAKSSSAVRGVRGEADEENQPQCPAQGSWAVGCQSTVDRKAYSYCHSSRQQPRCYDSDHTRDPREACLS